MSGLDCINNFCSFSENRVTFTEGFDYQLMEVYDHLLERIIEKDTTNGAPFEIDMSLVRNMNCSGLMILSMLLIQIRDMERPIHLIISNEAPWYKKVMDDLVTINKNVQFEYRSIQ